MFRKHLKQAIDLAKQEYIVTLGIKPTRPATGYGYICKDEFVSGDGIKAFKVKEFKEKPDRKTAEEYVGSGYHDGRTKNVRSRPL